MSFYAEGGTWDGQVVPAAKKYEKYESLTLPPYSPTGKPEVRGDGLLSEVYRKTPRFKDGMCIYVFSSAHYHPTTPRNRHDRMPR